MPAIVKNKRSVERRNERERKRIRNVNLAFDELRQRVPFGVTDKRKISKVDTLQSAIEYIKVLEDLVRKRAKQAKSKRTEKIMETEQNIEIKTTNRPISSMLKTENQEYDHTLSTLAETSPVSLVDLENVSSPYSQNYSYSDTYMGKCSGRDDATDSGFSDDGQVELDYLHSPQNSPELFHPVIDTNVQSPDHVFNEQPITSEDFDAILENVTPLHCSTYADDLTSTFCKTVEYFPTDNTGHLPQTNPCISDEKCYAPL